METPKHILVFRFSALGDVAMTVPVLKILLLQYPRLQLTVVSDPFMQPLFEGIDRLHFYAADTRKEFKGLSGLYRLSRLIKKDIPYDAIADLHNVLRTKLLRFFLTGKPAAAIDKGRKEKKELTRPVNKKLRPLKSSFQRYADVLEKIGLPIVLKTGEGFLEKPPQASSLLPCKPENKRLIGIAAFAKHPAKMYPLEKMRELVRLLAADNRFCILLFGSKSEASTLLAWEQLSPSVHCLAGKFSFADELTIIARLDIMVSMDSANMHLASLFGVPVVSIWGGTHPYLGFYGWAQPLSNAIQEDMPCRPSSVFGNKECPEHGSKGCMQGITPLRIADKIREVIGLVAVGWLLVVSGS